MERDKTIRRYLKSHGLKLKWDDGRKMSFAIKSYRDSLGNDSAMILEKKKKSIKILVMGRGTWHSYFLREAEVIRSYLDDCDVKVCRRF